MAIDTIGDRGLTSFRDYMRETSTSALREVFGDEYTCMADFILPWVYSNEGLYACAGNFETFTVTMLAIVDAWSRDQTLLDYADNGAHEERRVTSVLGKYGLQHCVLSRHWFERCVFDFTHGADAQF